MTNTTQTYLGHCQACGRQQAAHVKTGKIAKHGYTTDYGFFNGTCNGSDYLPMEQDILITNRQIELLVNHAAQLTEKSQRETFDTLPFEVYEGRDNRGRRIKTTIRLTPEEYAADKRFYGKWEHAENSHRKALERQAAYLSGIARELEGWRSLYHGQPLQPREVEAPLRRESVASSKDAYARCEELKAQGKRDVRQRRDQWTRSHTITYRD